MVQKGKRNEKLFMYGNIAKNSWWNEIDKENWKGKNIKNWKMKKLRSIFLNKAKEKENCCVEKLVKKTAGETKLNEKKIIKSENIWYGTMNIKKHICRVSEDFKKYVNVRKKQLMKRNQTKTKGEKIRKWKSNYKKKKKKLHTKKKS